MRLLILGCGGVGAAAAEIASGRDAFTHVVCADVDLDRARAAAQATAEEHFTAARVDASDKAAIADVLRHEQIEVVLNACDPRFNPSIFKAARACGATYVDMAMTLSQPHPDRPYELPGVKLGDAQLAAHDEWRNAGQLALVGMGVEPGLSDVFARYAQDHLFTSIDEVAVRDGANLAVEGYDFAPTFNIWTTIEECLNPPLIWERDRGFYTTAPFSEPETFVFPAGIGPLECVNVEHEEVVLVPRVVDCNRVTFKYGLGEEFVAVLRTLHQLGLDRTAPVTVGGVDVSPRDVVAACLPDPATLGDRMTGVTCAGTYVTGLGGDGRPRRTYLHHVVDNAWSMRVHGHQAVVWQTALCVMVAIELLADGTWEGAGVLGPEAFDAAPYLERLADFGAPHAVDER